MDIQKIPRGKVIILLGDPSPAKELTIQALEQETLGTKSRLRKCHISKCDTEEKLVIDIAVDSGFTVLVEVPANEYLATYELLREYSPISFGIIGGEENQKIIEISKKTNHPFFKLVGTDRTSSSPEIVADFYQRRAIYMLAITDIEYEIARVEAEMIDLVVGTEEFNIQEHELSRLIEQKREFSRLGSLHEKMDDGRTFVPENLVAVLLIRVIDQLGRNLETERSLRFSIH